MSCMEKADVPNAKATRTRTDLAGVTELGPGMLKLGPLAGGRCQRRIARLLLPKRGDIEQQLSDGNALNHLNQTDFIEVAQ